MKKIYTYTTIPLFISVFFCITGCTSRHHANIPISPLDLYHAINPEMNMPQAIQIISQATGDKKDMLSIRKDNQGYDHWRIVWKPVTNMETSVEIAFKHNVVTGILYVHYRLGAGHVFTEEMYKEGESLVK